MVALVLDSLLEEELLAHRRACRGDRYDEVWEGVYVMTPLANNEHQELVGRLAHVLVAVVNDAGSGRAFPGCNVSDREDDWTKNYRCPDAAVFLKGTRATDRDTHWFGGPDFAVEITSPHDRTREKFDFYAAVGTRELLIVDRDPWALELYRLDGGDLRLVGRSTVEQSAVLAREVLPLSWRLIGGDERPRIEVLHADGVQRWTV